MDPVDGISELGAVAPEYIPLAIAQSTLNISLKWFNYTKSPFLEPISER